ncbi:hypothetical protein [Marinicella meishanensis]|uniref:hypothetical protein n=1 Tax=Marinicella meishanensis TaxID=2873263 RepID=UPI001CBADB99|nr:hypothetical protein [Marinicella sp. NBU2979]
MERIFTPARRGKYRMYLINPCLAIHYQQHHLKHHLGRRANIQTTLLDSKKLSGTIFHASPEGVNRWDAMNKYSSGMNFTIHIPVNDPTGYMKKFSRNFFDAAGAC